MILKTYGSFFDLDDYCVKKYTNGILKTILFSMAAFIFTGCATQGGNILLDYKDVQFFKVREAISGSNVSLKISGLAFHSSLAVENIETKKEPDCVVILVHLVPYSSNLTGNFTYDLNVPEGIDSVCFGIAKYLIWKRGVGPVQ